MFRSCRWHTYPFDTVDDYHESSFLVDASIKTASAATPKQYLCARPFRELLCGTVVPRSASFHWAPLLVLDMTCTCVVPPQDEGQSHLVDKLTKTVGFGMGLEFRESVNSLSATNSTPVRAGMVFNVSLGEPTACLLVSPASLLWTRSPEF